MDSFFSRSVERQRLRRHWMISRCLCRSVCDVELKQFGIAMETLGCRLQLCYLDEC
jgi:hypothetical protein